MSKKKLIPEWRFPEFENDGEWKEKSIGEFAPLQRGYDLPVNNIIEGKYPVVFSNGILKYHNEYKVHAPGIVTGRSGTIGKVTFVQENFWPHNTTLWVTDFYGNYPLFVFYYFIQIKLGQFGTGSGVPTLNRNDVHRHKLFIPKYKEQQKIASCLSSLEELINAHSEKLEALKNHKKGLLQNLFPQEGQTVPNYRFPEFKNDREWVEDTLGNLSDVRDGTHDSPKYVSEGYPLITSKNLLNNGRMDFDNVSYLTEEDYFQINRRSKVDEGDILFGMIGTIGNPVIVEKEGFAIKNVALIKSINKLDQEFLLHQLKSNFILKQFEKVNAGGILKFLALGVIRNLNITFSSPKEQEKISSCLSSLDELINVQEEKIEQLKLHKKGLMQGLFPKTTD